MSKVMLRPRFTFLLLCLFVVASSYARQQQVIGYYPTWKLWDRDSLVTPRTIRYAKLTMVNVAFLYPTPDGKIVGHDSLAEAEGTIFLGERRGQTDARIGETSLVSLAHRNGVKVMLSIGGWEGSNDFPAMAAATETREAFASACVQHIAAYRLDGVDIDWEYPCYEEHKGTPDDGENFVLLMEVVRDSLDALGRQTGKDYLLTAAVPAISRFSDKMNIAAAAPFLDYLNVMTYDFFGPWEPESNHNAPLYASARGDSTYNVDAAFRLYRERYGVPASKINLGVPFYGRTYRNCALLHAPHEGVDEDLFPGGAFYHNIVASLHEFNRIWDDRAKVPYLVHKHRQSFVSYDDEESVKAKAQYVLNHEAAGLIIWEITGDFFPDGSTPLLDVINRTFNRRR